ncbi:MAG: SRPBCC family protein [Actinobacteria bacterium]|nr:SRPBCC family protein [Actinomycetota bacterium]
MTKNKTTIIAEPEKQEIIIIREFDAPRELVFKAYTDPELYKQWLGPRNLTMKIEKFEPRFGGTYRYIHIDENGNEYAFHGVYHEVRPPELIIDTFEFEGLPEPGHAALETLKLEELPGGRTKTVSHSVFQSVADRDGMIGTDIERGINEGYDRLDELLEKMQKPAA